jgi:23S rRNA pseudouridine2604 synthase
MKASWQSEQKLRFAFKGLDPSRLPALCQGVGLTVTSLRRIRIGRVPMAGLPVGMWRGLQTHERF